MDEGNDKSSIPLATPVLLVAFLAAGERAWGADLPQLLPTPAFIDTRTMTRLTGQDLPPVILLPDLVTAEPLMPSKTPWPSEVLSPARIVAAGGDVALGGGFQGNGSVSTEAGLAHRGGEQGSVWAGVRHDLAKPYEDGAGQRVNSGYNRTDTQMAASWRPSPGTRVSGFVMRDSFNNYRLPNYGIDATRLDHYAASTILDHRSAESVFDHVQAALVFDGTSYDADNVTLRDRGSLGLGYKGLLTTTRGLLSGDFTTGRFRNSVTAELAVLHHDIGINALYPSTGVAVYRLPDVETVMAGVTCQTSTMLSAQDGLSAGIRLDGIHADPNKRSQQPTITGTGASSFQVSPSQLWRTYYGTTESEPTNVNVSARLRATHDLMDKSGQVYLDLRRAVRNPDAGERFYANSGPNSLLQVGNPNLAPEAHHRLELGGRQDGGGFKGNFAPGNPGGAWRVAVFGYGDRVMDFITADRARGQDGILKSDGAIVYRNVDAYLAGAGVEAWWQVAEHWGARAKLSWTRGENLTDSRPLYQIPPLDGEVVLEHRRELAPDAIGSAGARLSFAGTQNRIDAYSASGSGQDTAGATSGWALLDLFAALRLGTRAALTAGIANVLDKHYHLHVNPLPESPTTRLQWAPGRSAFVQATVAF